MFSVLWSSGLNSRNGVSDLMFDFGSFFLVKLLLSATKKVIISLKQFVCLSLSIRICICYEMVALQKIGKRKTERKMYKKENWMENIKGIEKEVKTERK